MITATRLRCQTCPDYINTLKGQLLTVVSKPLCQPWCFCSSWSKCIIFTLSCCHKHFGLRCSSEHLCYPARRHCSHIDERWWGTNCWNLDVILKLCRKGCGILYLINSVCASLCWTTWLRESNWPAVQLRSQWKYKTNTHSISDPWPWMYYANITSRME